MALVIKTKAIPTPKIYRFGKQTDGKASMKNELGGKGANLAEMASLGIRVPDGFTIPCEASVEYNKLKNPEKYMSAIMDAVYVNMKHLQTTYGYMPLVSVRSGARVSMPGMMDTILNVGLTESTLPFWVGRIGEKAALDSYRRLIQMYGSVALEVDLKHFDHVLEEVKQDAGVNSDSELVPSSLERVISRYLDVIKKHGHEFPQTVEGQVQGAIEAVFRSWHNPRAIEYRQIYNIPDNWGTAVTVQSMVFGNMNDQSATGVVFTRDPSTGANLVTGEFLVNAQGEDVVAGIRTPEPLENMVEWDSDIYQSLLAVLDMLENHYKDMQDVEFTIQDGVLYILQTRNAKRSAKAAFKVARDLALEGLISKEEALERVNSTQLMQTLKSVIDPNWKVDPDVVGIAAGGGLVSGVVMLTAESAINCTEPCILVTKETDPDDIGGMNASVGILTATGGLTSHAAVVARGMNKACVVGATSLKVVNSGFYVEGNGNNQLYVEGTKITIDGATGHVWLAQDVPVFAGELTDDVADILEWASGETPIKVDAYMSKFEVTLPQVAAKGMTVTTGLLFADTFTHTATIARTTELGQVLYTMAEQGKLPTRVTIDLSTVQEQYSNADKMSIFMFGLPSEDYTKDKVSAVVNNWSPILKEYVSFKNAKEWTKVLAKEGWGTHTKVQTMEDLYLAKGVLEIDDSVVKTIFGTPAMYQKIKTLIEKETGNETTSDVGSQYWFSVLEKES